MEKIKILYTIPNFDTAGSGKVVYDLANNLDKNIFAPEICVFHTKGAYFKEVEKLNVPIHLFQFTTPYKPLTSFLFRVWKIRKFFKKHQFNIIHSWHWSSDFSEPLASKLAGIPFVYTKKAMGWGNKAWKIRTSLSTKVIAINEDMVLNYFKTYSNKVIKLPLGVDTIFYQPQLKNENLLIDLKIKTNDFVIVSVVNMVPVKGIEILIEAIKLMNSNSVKLLIIGNDKNEYAEYLKIKYENENVLFLGKKIDVKPYLSIADLFVIPTKDEGRKEGMPIAPLEAMAMGVPVIGSNISGIKDILEDFPEFLFTPSDLKGLAEKIITIQNLNLKEKIALNKKFRETTVNNFSLHNFVSTREELYKSMIK